VSTVARNPLAGTLAITSRIFETWAGDEPRFVADFEALASILWLRSGIAIATNTEELHSAVAFGAASLAGSADAGRNDSSKPL
jgi:hypothetical protein